MRTRRRRTVDQYVQPFDSVHRPPLASDVATNAARLEQSRDFHTFGSGELVARAYSYYAEPMPNPAGIALMGLAGEARAIEEATSMRAVLPFPGVALGPGPGFHRAPNTTPMLGGFDHLRYHAHERR